jgi:hypothetical protein
MLKGRDLQGNPEQDDSVRDMTSREERHTKKNKTKA